MIRVVAAAIVRDGQVLAARRGEHAREAWRWELPGGKVEGTETDADALTREIREELGVVIRVDAPLAESVHHYAHMTVHLVAYRCTLLDGVPEAREHAELRWLGAAEIAALEWAPADEPLLGPLGALLA